MRLIPWVLGVALVLPAADVLAGWGAGGGGKFREEMAASRAAAFEEADADKNGGLTLEEFGTFQELVQRQRREPMFNRLDSDDDGVVNEEELNAHPGGPWGRRGRRGGHHGGAGW